MPTACKEHNLVKSAEAHNGSKWHCVQKDENSCELKSVESTTISQRLIYGDVCTEACKEAVWRIPAQRLLGHVFYPVFAFGVVGVRISDVF